MTGADQPDLDPEALTRELAGAGVAGVTIAWIDNARPSAPRRAGMGYG